MKALFITVENADAKKVEQALKMIKGITGIKSLSDEEATDLGLLKAMEKNRTGKYVSRDKIMKLLGE